MLTYKIIFWIALLLRVKWHSGDIGILCCIFKECEPGYHGTNCSSACKQNYYGRLCRERCNCSSNQYCDSIVGCLCKNNSVNCTDQHQGVYHSMFPFRVILAWKLNSINFRSTYNTYDIRFPNYVDQEETSVGVTDIGQCKYYDAYYFQKNWQ